MFDWITGLVRQTGYLGIVALMLGENVFPPIPSELIMPLAGFTAVQGHLSLLGVVVAGTVGSLAGVSLWYWVGVKLGTERMKRFSRDHGRWLTLSPADIDRANDWFRQHGGAAVMFGRLIPTVRTLISVPAGVSGMSFGRFLAFSAAGTLAWTTILALAGYWLEASYGKVEQYVGPVSNVLVAMLVIGYAYRVVTFDPGDEGET